MIIGIDAHMLGDNSGGNESYYTGFLKHFEPKPEMHVIVFVRKGLKGMVPWLDDRFSVVEFEENNAFKRNFIELPKLCEKYDLDILHTQYFIPFKRPCKVVVSIHDICFEHYSNIFTKKDYVTQKTLIPYSARKAAAVLTLSEYSKKDIHKTYRIDPGKIRVTQCAVDTEVFKVLDPEELNEKELRKRFDIGEGKYVLSVGNLQPRKNLARLIKAFAIFREKTQTDTRLVIVGKKAWLYDDTINSAHEHNIVLTDYVCEQDLVRLYNAADCFVYPSFFEGFGLPPVESMSCGTPVAVARRTSLPEAVGKAGLYFDPFDENDIADKLEQLLMRSEERDADLRAKMQEQIARFSWKNTADIIGSTYEEVYSK